MRKKLLLALLTAGICLAAGVQASDHDDGESDLKARALNLTDVYLFKEQAAAAR